MSWEIWDLLVDDVEHVFKNVVQFQYLRKLKRFNRGKFVKYGFINDTGSVERPRIIFTY